jgi:predicted RNase H-like HicB family nuclease
MKKQLRRTVHENAAVFEPDEDQGGYTVYIPALPGCISEGDTFEKAVESIREAATLYREVATCTV